MKKKSFEREYEIRRARRKHEKTLRRKGIRYVPTFNPARDTGMTPYEPEKIPLFAPLNFSILTNTSEVIKYFADVRHNIDARIPTIMDMSGIVSTDFPTICLLIATMMDSRATVRNILRYLTVRIPRRGTKTAELFEKAQFRQTVTRKGIADHGYFLSRLDTALNEAYTLDILNHSKRFFGEEFDLSSLSPIFVEILTNTNNHADPNRGDEPNEVPWFASVLEAPDEDLVRYCVIDLGIGIHESLKQKGIKLSKQGKISVDRIQSIFGASQSELLSKSIPRGVESSTKLIYRGQGLKDIYDKATQGPYQMFEIITNKANVNITNISDVREDSEYNFEGTIYYWEIYGG